MSIFLNYQEIKNDRPTLTVQLPGIKPREPSSQDFVGRPLQPGLQQQGVELDTAALPVSEGVLVGGDGGAGTDVHLFSY